MATNDRPWAASQSASAAVARAAVVSAGLVSVIFSTPRTRAELTSPEATAISPARRAEPPELHAVSILTASAPFKLTQSAIIVPRFSWRFNEPESMLPTKSASTSVRPASARAAKIASPASSFNVRSQGSETGVWPKPRIATLRIWYVYPHRADYKTCGCQKLSRTGIVIKVDICHLYGQQISVILGIPLQVKEGLLAG